MSDAVASFSITIPPQSVNLPPFACPIGFSDVQDILVVVPAGCAGNVGFQIWAGGSPAYPQEQSQFFIFDDYTYDQLVSSQINSGDWAIVAYNNDQFQHTLQVYFRYNYIQYSPSLALGTPIGLASD